MKQDMILIVELGGKENAALAREIRAMGVYTEIPVSYTHLRPI